MRCYLVWIMSKLMHPVGCRVNNNNSRSFCNKKALRIEKDGSYLARSTWSISLGDIRSELSLGNNPSLNSGTVRWLFKMFSNFAVKVLLELVTGKIVQVGQRYASHEAVLAVSRSSYVPGRIVSSLKDYCKQRIVIQNVSVGGTIIQQIFACE